jgi:hypothetical protein
MAKNLILAGKYLQENNASALASIIQPPTGPNVTLSTFRLRPYVTAARNKVPIVSAAAAYGSLDCLDLLIKSGANLEAQDDRGVSFFLIGLQFIGQRKPVGQILWPVFFPRRPQHHRIQSKQHRFCWLHV